MATSAVVGPGNDGNAQLVRRFAAVERRLPFWIALWLLVAVAQFLALIPVLFPAAGEPVQPIDVVFRLMGGSFAACGLIAWHRRPDSQIGRLMTATGFAFWIQPLLSQLRWPVATTVSLWLPDLWLLFFVAMLLTYFTGGRLRTLPERLILGAAVFQFLVLAPLWLMFTDIPGNLFLISPNEQVAGVVDTVQRACFSGIALASAIVLSTRWRAASRPGRRAMLPVIAGSACLLMLALLLIVDLILGDRFMPLFWISACSLITVPAAFLAGLLRSRLARGALSDLFRQLRTMRPAALQAALASALGDPQLLIAYPVAGRGYVDADGRPLELPAPGDGRSVALVERDGAPVAALVYDQTFDDDPELVEAVGGAASIALENQHLQAEAEQRLEELKASRERIIAAGDLERRRIERNLHDGAQQRLVTVALQLSLIQRQIRGDPADMEELVAAASAELAQSLAELRELARGIHPAALEQGLYYALESLAQRSFVPTTVACDPNTTVPRAVEFAAYFVASEALANVSKYAAATAVTITVTRSSDMMLIEIADDGVGGADAANGSGLRGLADRVEALDGRLTVHSPVGAGTTVRAEIPVGVDPRDGGSGGHRVGAEGQPQVSPGPSR